MAQPALVLVLAGGAEAGAVAEAGAKAGAAMPGVATGVAAADPAEVVAGAGHAYRSS